MEKMRKLIICLISCSTFYGLQAQVIEGTVYDAKTKETIPGVVIYLDGTTINTTTDRDGRFRLVINQTVNTKLVFSHLSYESLIITPPFERLGKTIFLNEKTNILQEARVVAGRDWFPRETKMTVFKEQFLGTSEAGKSCTILNEDDIVLTYDNTTNILTGYSRQPIIIENRYLAYLVTFDLHSFSVHYTESNTLDMRKSFKVAFKGTSSFVDQSPYSIRFKTRRDETYLRSKQYFFKNLVANTLEEAKFRLFNRVARINPEQYFMTDGQEAFIIPGTNIRSRHNMVEEGPIYGVIRILYDNTLTSEIVFLTNKVSVDEFGNPDTVDNLIFFGDMGGQRLGNMLPRDFVWRP